MVILPCQAPVECKNANASEVRNVILVILSNRAGLIIPDGISAQGFGQTQVAFDQYLRACGEPKANPYCCFQRLGLPGATIWKRVWELIEMRSARRTSPGRSPISWGLQTPVPC